MIATRMGSHSHDRDNGSVSLIQFQCRFSARQVVTTIFLITKAVTLSGNEWAAANGERQKKAMKLIILIIEHWKK